MPGRLRRADHLQRLQRRHEHRARRDLRPGAEPARIPGEEAIRRANDTEYGLAAGVVTPDLARAHRIIHRLEAGICWINTWGESPAQMPVGGYKQSGIGRENGIASLAHYTRVKSVQVELGEFASVF